MYVLAEVFAGTDGVLSSSAGRGLRADSKVRPGGCVWMGREPRERAGSRVFGMVLWDSTSIGFLSTFF